MIAGGSFLQVTIVSMETVAKRKRSSLPKDLQLRVYRRDGWLCRWCSRPVVFAPAMRVLELWIKGQGCASPLAYYDTNWRRDRAPLLDHLGAVVDHVEAFARGGLHDESNFVTSCNKCNTRKNSEAVSAFQRRSPLLRVKGKYGEPRNWDGLTTLFVLLAPQKVADLKASERAWLKALG
jgi:5-methylcytosine-specific restriction endonuclease McrA